MIATVIETHHDEHGIIWPKSIAPFTCVIMNFGLDQNNCVEASEKLFNQLAAHNIDVLYDDIDDSIGPRFAKMDLIGIPLQLRIFPKKILNNIVEVKNRATGEIFDVGIEEVLKICI